MLIFEEQLLADIPDAFQGMEQDKIEMMYPYEERPQIILDDGQRGRFCTFSLLEGQGLADEQAGDAARVMGKVVKGLYPSCLLEEPQTMDAEGGTCGWFSFKSPGTEGEIWNVMYVFPVNGNMMLGTLGCLAEDEAGKEQMMEIMGSLKALKKKSPWNISGIGGRIL